jgi:hypothetical protein
VFTGDIFSVATFVTVTTTWEYDKVRQLAASVSLTGTLIIRPYCHTKRHSHTFTEEN